MGVRTKKRVESIAIHGILILLVLVCVFPILWMCLISVKDTSESISGWNSLWVNNPTLDNYR